MKKNAVMLADTRTALVGTTLLQIQKSNPGLFNEAIIYYLDPISDADRERMCSIVPCRFVKYDPPLSTELLQRPRFRLFSLLMFCRYEMFSYLDEFETVTWLDTDILLQGSLKEMLQAAKKTGAALIREDPVNKTAEKPDRMRTCFTTDLPGYDMNEYLYCSGTIVLSQKIKSAKAFTRWCYEKTAQWANILSLPDQGVINAAIQEFDICVTPLSGKKYCCYPYMGRDCSQATIVHAWGLNKFWNDWYTFLNFPAWDGYYKEWLQLGGSPLQFIIAPRVSIVIPTYKPDTVLLRQCLDSLMTQNRGNWERFSDFEIIIVAEPFDEDALREVVSSYDDRRICLEFNKERIGIAASLNRGLRMAQGRYIARMDDDDLCAPARLYKQAEYLDQHPEITLCTSDFEYFGDMNESRVSFEGDMSHAWSIFTCPFDHPTIMFRRDFFKEHSLYYDEKRGYVEDWELWRRAFQAGMRVGCVHEVLFYHRWINAGSAGQSNKTVDMMRELIQKNFAELGVSIPTEDLHLIGPWNGRISEEDTGKLESYFCNALVANEKKQIYNQKSLEEAFSLRLEEARTGVLPGLSKEIRRHSAENEPPELVQTIGKERSSFLKKILKAILKPLYRPFRHRFEDRIIAIQESGWTVEGHVLNCINKLDQIIAAQQMQIELIQQELTQTKTKMESLLSRWSLETQEQLTARMIDEAENVRQKLSARLSTEAENTRQELSTKLFTEAENTRQELSAKVYIETESTRGQMTRVSDIISSGITTIGDHVYDVEQELRFQRGILLSGKAKERKLFLIGTPEHSNIGDAAITLGERAFLRKYFPGLSIVELASYDFDSWYGKIGDMIEPDDLIFLQGGGNLGSRFLQEERIRRRIITDFPMNRIVILPQTIYFDQDEFGQRELEKSREIYNRHPHLTICTRGRQSMAFAKQHFTNANVVNSLDMALMINYQSNIPRKGALLCLRDLDDESGLDSVAYNRIVEIVKKSFPDCLRTNNLNRGDLEANIIRDMRREVVTGELAKYAASKVVVTDRLHGLIFSIITHTPCVVLSAFNQKIAEFCEFFLDSKGVFFIDKNIDLLPGSIEQALQVEEPKYPILDSGCWDRVFYALQER